MERGKGKGSRIMAYLICHCSILSILITCGEERSNLTKTQPLHSLLAPQAVAAAAVVVMVANDGMAWVYLTNNNG
jgi:hypothetical protein